MPIVSVPYKPEHVAFGDKPVWVSATDGDTPTLQFPIRMLGINASELHYQDATATTAGKFDVPLGTFLTAAGKGLNAGLKEHLAKSYSTMPAPGTLRPGKLHLNTSRLWLKNGLRERAKTANRLRLGICS